MQNRIIDIKLVTDMVAEPVSLTEAKNYLHIDYTADDALLQTIIKAARKRLERYTGLSFGSKTMKVLMDIWAYQVLPYGRVLSVTSATREGEADDAYVMKGDEFHPELGGEWEVTYTTNGELPEDLKLAVLAEVAFRYENRGDVNEATISQQAKELARAYKNYSWV